jgi:NAD-dependent DNA ligase
MNTMNMTIDGLVQRLKAASVAYYETADPLMTDDEYDALVENLRLLAPDHAYFQVVGAPVGEGAIRLPLPMPSLRKVKPESVDAWTASYAGPWLVSDKLDGISALWVPSRGGLYLRGDGLVGQDVSHLVPLGIQGLVRGDALKGMEDVIIRGELIVPKRDAVLLKAGAASGLAVGLAACARNWVNGVLHQKTPLPADVAAIQFVSYSVYSKKPLKRALQMKWLKEAGFICVPNNTVMTADAFGPLLEKRRAEGSYDIDGLVVGVALAVPEVLDARAGLPKDCVAFKMPLADQRAHAEVVAVHWASSMGGLWIPRVEIKPVKIGVATITYATGHNAKFIHENSIGPGALISIRRSGDVIPTIEGVLIPAEDPYMPEGTLEPKEELWAWDERGTHALDTRGVEDAEKKGLFMVDTLTAFDIEGVSTKNALKLVEGGLDGLVPLYRASHAQLVACVGTALGAKLYEQLHTKIHAASPERWVTAYQGWPRGFGKQRVQALLALAPVEQWPTLKTPPRGMGADSFASTIGCVGGFLAWRGELGYSAPAPAVKPAVALAPPAKGGICMTGFRDAALTERLVAAGWEIHDTVKKATTVLLVADEAGMGTTKAAAAQAKGVRILLRKDVSSLL